MSGNVNSAISVQEADFQCLSASQHEREGAMAQASRQDKAVARLKRNRRSEAPDCVQTRNRGSGISTHGDVDSGRRSRQAVIARNSHPAELPQRDPERPYRGAAKKSRHFRLASGYANAKKVLDGVPAIQIPADSWISGEI